MSLRYPERKYTLAVNIKNIRLGQKNNTLVSGNAGDEKNLHSGDRKLIFLIDFPERFSFLL